MKYNLKVYNIQEDGQRKDANGNPHQEDSIFPTKGTATDHDRLFILCDGMGGHDAGEVASQTVCAAMSNSILMAQPDVEGAFTEEILQKGISDAFFALDNKDTGAAKKMGTTMTVLKLFNGGAIIAHMGDSRVYHIRPGKTAADTKILFQTRDHSLVNDLIAIGELTEEEAKSSRQKNVITRAMQPHMDRRPKADIKLIPDEKDPNIQSGDYFYMCSDGMLEHMENEQLCYFFSESAGTDEEKVQKLISATIENRDNHSAIIVHILDVLPDDASIENMQDKPRLSEAPRLMAEIHEEDEQNDGFGKQPSDNPETEVEDKQDGPVETALSQSAKFNAENIIPPTQNNIQRQTTEENKQQHDKPDKWLKIKNIAIGVAITAVVVGGFFGIRSCKKSDKGEKENQQEQTIPAKEETTLSTPSPAQRPLRTESSQTTNEASSTTNQTSPAAANIATEFVEGGNQPNGSAIQTTIQSVSTTVPKQDEGTVSSDKDKINEVVNPGK